MLIKKFALSLMGAACLLATPMFASAEEVPTKPEVAETRDSYLIVTRQDFRKCAYPMCGGYFVKAVNKPRTRCADGTLQPECHAVQLNARALGWTDEQRAAFDAEFAQGKAIVRGVLEPAPAGFYTADQLTITEAWSAQGDKKPMGFFYGVKSTGIVCITTPCPSLAAIKLNTLSKPVNPSLDLSPSGVDDRTLQAGLEALNTSGILASGVIVPMPVNGTLDGKVRRELKLIANQFYVPAKP
ncbi:MAG: hypothetical protein QM742_18440 [Aquabacterium sp.]